MSWYFYMLNPFWDGKRFSFHPGLMPNCWDKGEHNKNGSCDTIFIYIYTYFDGRSRAIKNKRNKLQWQRMAMNIDKARNFIYRKYKQTHTSIEQTLSPGDFSFCIWPRKCHVFLIGTNNVWRLFMFIFKKVYIFEQLLSKWLQFFPFYRPHFLSSVIFFFLWFAFNHRKLLR